MALISETDGYLLECRECEFSALVKLTDIQKFQCLVVLDGKRFSIDENLIPIHCATEADVKLYLLQHSFDLTLCGRSIVQLKEVL